MDRTIMDSAADWHVRLAGDAPDFEGFTRWLEADPRHVAAYDAVIEVDDIVASVPPVQWPASPDKVTPPAPANDDEPRARRWWGAGVAAAVAIIAGSGLLLTQPLPWARGGGDAPMVAMADNAVRTITLADATRITLDRHSQLAYAGGSARAIELRQGGAMFAVTHDAARPFTVAAGGYTVTDLGTEFAVFRHRDGISISVASGLVELAGPGISHLKVTPGERVDILAGRVVRTRVDAADVGSWQGGRLVYDNAPLSLVVADINRYVPQQIDLDPSVADRRFSGVLSIGDGSGLSSSLADLMGLSLDPDGGRTRLGDRARR